MAVCFSDFNLLPIRFHFFISACFLSFPPSPPPFLLLCLAAEKVSDIFRSIIWDFLIGRWLTTFIVIWWLGCVHESFLESNLAIVGDSVQLMRKDCQGNKKFPPFLECERIVGCFFIFWFLWVFLILLC